MTSDARDYSGCDYCGLPLGTTPSDAQTPQFCCVGCRVASAISHESGEEGHNRWMLTRLGLAIFFTMNVMVFTLALWSWDVYQSDAALSSPSASVLFELFRYLSLLLSSIVVLMLGGPLLESAYENLRRHVVTIDLLIVTGVVAAVIYSFVSVITGGRHTYFEVACVVLVGVTLGRWLEAVGKLKTTNALRSLERLLPASARVVGRIAELPAAPAEGFVVRPAGEESVVLDDVEVGHVIRVLPGERIATDGVIRRGQAAVDEKIVTGESVPAIKEAGDQVYAGTLNQDGDLLIEVTAAPRGGALLRIIAAVTQAATAKSHLQSNADRLASWFVPGVAVIALATFAVHTSMAGIGNGLMAALAVLLIACPCALGIATPLAVWAAVGRASSAGVLFRHGDALQQLAAAKVICFDKTGTLTTGQALVDQFIVDLDTRADEVLRAAAILAASSTHAFSSAIRKHALAQLDVTTIPQPAELETRPGRGVVARLDHSSGPIYLGSLALMEEAVLRRSPAMREAINDVCQAGQPLVCIGWEGRVRGVFSFHEQFRDEAHSSLEGLRAAGFHVAILTGDHAARGAAIERAIGIAVEAELLPEQKLAAIRDLRRMHGPVVMVGDGINDAPALTEADVGIAMGCGADVSREAADLCLLGDNLEQVGWSIELAKRTMRTVRQNLFWAFSYNGIGILLAATGVLNPIWSAVAMVGSSLFVISNSLRLSNSEAFADEGAARAEQQISVSSIVACPVLPESGAASSVS